MWIHECRYGMFLPIIDLTSEASNSSQSLELKKYTAVGLKGIQSHHVNVTGQYMQYNDLTNINLICIKPTRR